MNDPKKNDVSVRSDKATGIASRVHGSNIDAVAFNVDPDCQRVLTIMLAEEY